MDAQASLSLDMRSTALVLIDLQNGIVAMNVHPQPSAEVVSRSRQLADAFRAVHAPVVLVTVGNLTDGKDALMPACDAGYPAPAERPANWSTVVDAMGAFYGTELDLQLRRRGIRTIVLAGISTHVGVESTARDAFERGYEQVFVTDAMGSPSAEAHASTLKFVFPRLGLARSTEQVLKAIKA